MSSSFTCTRCGTVYGWVTRVLREEVHALFRRELDSCAREECIAPSCEVCRGACCETIVLPRHIVQEFHEDWITTRGTGLPDGQVELECPCPKLTTEGRCGVYEKRPLPCRTFAVGGIPCLSALVRRRTPEQIEAIFNSTRPPRPEGA